jgi:hypothetical protein
MVSETTLSKQLPSVPAVYEEGNGSSQRSWQILVFGGQAAIQSSAVSSGL